MNLRVKSKIEDGRWKMPRKTALPSCGKLKTAWRLTRLFVIFYLLSSICYLQAATLNVTNYGARGDAINFSVNCVSNSAVVTTTNQLSSADIGKVISIVASGPYTTNGYFQDLVASITNVVNGTNLYMSRLAGHTTNLASGIYGTCSTTGIVAAINAAVSGDTISIPVGRYLVIPPVFDATWMASYRQNEAAVTIRKGGIRFLGDDRNNTVLIGNGAWQLTAGSVYRGHMFILEGPFTNAISSDLIFENMTLDGGVAIGRTSITTPEYPGNVVTGDGWDRTHSAAIVYGTAPPFCTNNIFLNINFVHWRGEMVKGLYNYVSGEIYRMTNCAFSDGNASANNIQAGNVMSGCAFTNLDIVMEIWQSCSPFPSYFVNNYVTNCRYGITVQGADTNRQPQAAYYITSNTMQVAEVCVSISPAQNVIVDGNHFHDSAAALLPGAAGSQGTAAISNIVFINNRSTNVYNNLVLYAGTHIYLTNNIFKNAAGNAGFAISVGGVGGNIFFYNNVAQSDRGSFFDAASVQLPFDDLSNDFPFNLVSDQHEGANRISYRFGARQKINQSGSWCLDDSVPSQIPPLASMVVSNSSGSTVTLYKGTAQTSSITMTNTQTATFMWWLGAWALLPIRGNAIINGVFNISRPL